jgi:hypothetical protein
MELPITGSGQDSQESSFNDGQGDVPVGQQTFNWVLGTIKAALSGAQVRFPNLRIADLLAATSSPIKCSAIKLGPNGACLDMLSLQRGWMHIQAPSN